MSKCMFIQNYNVLIDTGNIHSSHQKCLYVSREIRLNISEEPVCVLVFIYTVKNPAVQKFVDSC